MLDFAVCAATGERSLEFDPGTAPRIKGPKGDAALKLLHSGKLNRHHTSLIQRKWQAVCQRYHASDVMPEQAYDEKSTQTVEFFVSYVFTPSTCRTYNPSLCGCFILSLLFKPYHSL